jgi:hypothetical protein
MVYWSYEAGESDYGEDGLGATVRNVVSTATHFFTRTRWNRLFHQIR